MLSTREETQLMFFFFLYNNGQVKNIIIKVEKALRIFLENKNCKKSQR